jgi:hypothetical protein
MLAFDFIHKENSCSFFIILVDMNKNPCTTGNSIVPGQSTGDEWE